MTPTDARMPPMGYAVRPETTAAYQQLEAEIVRLRSEVERLRGVDDELNELMGGGLAQALRDALAEVERLQVMLLEASDAFDDCTHDEAKALVENEDWRQYVLAASPPQETETGEPGAA